MIMVMKQDTEIPPAVAPRDQYPMVVHWIMTFWIMSGTAISMGFIDLLTDPTTTS